MTLPRTNPLPPNPWPTFALCSLALFLVLLDTTVSSVTFTAMFFGFFFFMTRVWGLGAAEGRPGDDARTLDGHPGGDHRRAARRAESVTVPCS